MKILSCAVLVVLLGAFAVLLLDDTAWVPWAIWAAFAATGALALVLFVRLGRARATAATSARTDVLTGLPNRRAIDESLEREHAYASRHNCDLGVLLIDIDHFKGINDGRGRNVGDLVLVVVAKTLESSLRTEDIIGRWGGDDFLVVLRAPTEVGAFELAHRLRVAVEDLQIALVDDPQAITVSVGGTVGRCSTADLVERADAELHAAKQAGRNAVSVVICEEPPPTGAHLRS